MNCPACTFANEAGASSCTICGSPLAPAAGGQPQPQQAEAAGAEWACAACTLVNPANAGACTACGSPNPAGPPAGGGGGGGGGGAGPGAMTVVEASTSQYAWGGGAGKGSPALGYCAPSAPRTPRAAPHSHTNLSHHTRRKRIPLSLSATRCVVPHAPEVLSPHFTPLASLIIRSAHSPLALASLPLTPSLPPRPPPPHTTTTAGKSACTMICVEACLRTLQAGALPDSPSILDDVVAKGCEAFVAAKDAAAAAAGGGGGEDGVEHMSAGEAMMMSPRYASALTGCGEVNGTTRPGGFADLLDQMTQRTAAWEQGGAAVCCAVLTKPPETILVVCLRAATFAAFDSHPDGSLGHQNATMMRFDEGRSGVEGYLAGRFQYMDGLDMYSDMMYNAYQGTLVDITPEGRQGAAQVEGGAQGAAQGAQAGGEGGDGGEGGGGMEGGEGGAGVGADAGANAGAGAGAVDEGQKEGDPASAVLAAAAAVLEAGEGAGATAAVGEEGSGFVTPPGARVPGMW